ncbi:hypothetical protein [Rhodococcus sp. 14-2470-1a]|uniref:hypothetical protein n=1 Tax=Rhodococcus sp. 14-2470-1a TaxID=2023150 RepID=UPI00117B6F12|nr:hypothetical protein [Rhodococcus sp. 14-2470-1a]
MEHWPQRPGPVAVPIDRWGHMPFPPAPMTADAVAAVVNASLTDSPPRRTARTPGHHRIDNESRTDTFETTAVAPVSADLDPGYYERGVQARRRANVATADVPGLVDEVEHRIEKLLQRTLNLLGDTFDDPF